MNDTPHLSRQQRRQLERRNKRGVINSFTSRWASLGERLAGKNTVDGLIFTEQIDKHLTVIVITIHSGCVSHAGTHILEAAEDWTVMHGDFNRGEDGGAS